MTDQIETEHAPNPLNDTAEVVWAIGQDYEYHTCSNVFQFKLAQPSGLIYLDPRPAAHEIAKIYPDHYEPYLFKQLPKPVAAARDLVQMGKVRTIADLLKKSDAKLLDFGCGSGSLLELLRKGGPKTWELHGSDFKIDAAKRLEATGIKIHQGRLDLEKYGHYFDCIILNQVIEHVEDVEATVRHCRALLKIGGLVFIETPSTEGLDAKVFRAGLWGGYHIPRHFYLFNEKNLASILNKNGFQTISAQYLTSPAFWIQSFRHWLNLRGMRRMAKCFKITNVVLLLLFTSFDLLRIGFGFKSSNMRLIAMAK